MAFGIGSAFKKGWKSTVGKLEDIARPYFGTIAGAALAPFTSGVSLAVGMQLDSVRMQEKQQESMIAAQLAAADKIAAAQNAPTIQAAVAPTASSQEASVSETNEATSKRKAFSFAKTRRMGTIQRRNTLG